MTPTVLTEWETLRYVATGTSMARLGDGEAKLAREVDAKTQPHHSGIGKRIRRLLANPPPGVLVCIPRIWPEPPMATPGFWPQHRGTFERFCKPGVIYGSAFVSRRDAWPIPDEDRYWREWQGIWAGRPALLVTGSGKGLATRKLLATAASVDVLDVPRPDAWSAYEGILADCRAWAAAKSDPIILAACGATATILAADLGAEGTQTLDVGHMSQSHARMSPKQMAEL